MTTILYAQSAQTDLLEAWLCIAKKGPQAADSVLDRIDTEARRLAMQPLMGGSDPSSAKGYAVGRHQRPTFCFIS